MFTSVSKNCGGTEEVVQLKPFLFSFLRQFLFCCFGGRFGLRGLPLEPVMFDASAMTGPGLASSKPPSGGSFAYSGAGDGPASGTLPPAASSTPAAGIMTIFPGQNDTSTVSGGFIPFMGGTVPPLSLGMQGFIPSSQPLTFEGALPAFPSSHASTAGQTASKEHVDEAVARNSRAGWWCSRSVCSCWRFLADSDKRINRNPVTKSSWFCFCVLCWQL